MKNPIELARDVMLKATMYC
ncbi:hypothetical protein OK016_07360 [Vibrio chagasii]|nr:hypothetical protein [Vibrio chagasii]